MDYWVHVQFCFYKPNKVLKIQFQSLSLGDPFDADSLVKTLQEDNGGWGQYRLANTLKTNLRFAMSEVIKQEVNNVIKSQNISPEMMQESVAKNFYFFSGSFNHGCSNTNGQIVMFMFKGLN